MMLDRQKLNGNISSWVSDAWMTKLYSYSRIIHLDFEASLLIEQYILN